MSLELKSGWILVCAGAGLAVGGLLSFFNLETAAAAVFTVVAVIPLLPVLRGIAVKIRRRQPGVDVIAVLAVSGSLVLGEFLTAAIIGLMLATGQFLEEYAAGRAERELTFLVMRAPRVAHRLRDGEIEVIDIAEVASEDLLVIKAGEVIPVDGVVVSPTAIVDESALTGEPLPVQRFAGDLVNSGAVNAADVFEISATASAEQSTYAGIIRLVEQARDSKAPSVRLADRWAAWFVPLTLGISGLAWVVSGDPIRALAVLVVATPCPLLLAVPTAIVSGISRAARRGIIFRGGGTLERLALTRNLVIDKTGTVTLGRPTLHSIVTFDATLAEADILRLAASVDQTSSHVLARTIVDAARQRNLELVIPTGVTEVVGSGVSGKVDGRIVAVGRLSWLLGDDAEGPRIVAFRRRMSQVSPIAVFISIDGQVHAAITFDDRIRPDAVTTIRALRRIGVSKVVMATGDQPVVARSVGLAIGADQVLSECTPREKVDALEELRNTGTTTMVGDGINDAPALAMADVGVAMGARGATASSEAADVVLMVDRLERLVDAIGIAQRSRRIAVESAALGMGLSLIAMTVASFGLLAPIAGALIQEGIDVMAILNALRALGGKTPTQIGPKLPAELSAQLRAEHDQLLPRLDTIRDAADNLDMVSTGDAMGELERICALLVQDILPHETQDETVIYPQVSDLLPGDDPMASMSRTHREIFYLVDMFQRQMADLPPAGPEPADIRDLRRTLYGLHAILRLHFDQEEELYVSLEPN
jgi:heavy metal translocating P-type ATPase